MRPLRSFGANQVDFGGIVSPESAILKKVSKLTGGKKIPSKFSDWSIRDVICSIPALPEIHWILLSVRTLQSGKKALII